MNKTTLPDQVEHKYVKPQRLYLGLIIAGGVLWLAQNIYFGFNEKPQSDPERVLDLISSIMIFWGIIGDILSNITIRKTYEVAGDLHQHDLRTVHTHYLKIQGGTSAIMNMDTKKLAKAIVEEKGGKKA